MIWSSLFSFSKSELGLSTLPVVSFHEDDLAIKLKVAIWPPYMAS